VYTFFDDELLVVAMLFPSGKSTSQNRCKRSKRIFQLGQALANYTRP